MLANRLAGNSVHCPLLEATLTGPTLAFTDATHAAIAGGGAIAHIDGRRVGPNAAFRVPAGGTAKIGPTKDGARAYIAVAGGLEAEWFLGSASTHLAAGRGGFNGRHLKRDDIITVRRTAPVPDTNHLDNHDPIFAFLSSTTIHPSVLRVVSGPDAECHPMDTSTSLKAALQWPFVVSRRADRMGIRLERRPEQNQVFDNDAAFVANIGSSGPVFPGTIQFPAGGEPTLLGPDCQTTGGYPRLLSVIQADVPRIGQLRPGTPLWLRLVTQPDALDALKTFRLLARHVAGDEINAWPLF